MTIERKPLSLYVHIPFCVRKCLYCDFLSGPAGSEEKEQYVNLLIREIKLWGQQLGKEYRLETIFLGGGTPSCLLPEQLRRIGEVIRENFHCGEVLEFTTEANPGTVTAEHIQAWKDMGINRVSLGLQSAQDQELSRLGRIHSYQDFLDTYMELQKAGYHNINVDLMSDIPGQTIESYQDTLEKITALKPQHISAYSLIVEPGTPFYEMEEQGILERKEEDIERQLYEMTEVFLKEKGFEQYEISNYALKGKECRHNCVYWQGKEYLGVGLGASSYFKYYRFSNQITMKAYEEYIRKAEENVQSVGKENLRMQPASANTDKEQLGWKEWEFADIISVSKKEQMEEFMFLGLRMKRGISKKEFKERFLVEIESVYGKVFSELFHKQLLAEDDSQERIYLTPKGIDLSNMVLAEFLLEE